mgnify:FL=1
MTELKKFKCHKVVSAKPMTWGEYENVRGIVFSEPEHQNKEGYLVIYNENTPDHYESWSPKKQFEEGYTPIVDGQQNYGIMKFFAFAHLPIALQTVSKPIGELAELINQSVPDGAEKSAGLRKLLEAKDCFVRASLK